MIVTEKNDEIKSKPLSSSKIDIIKMNYWYTNEKVVKSAETIKNLSKPNVSTTTVINSGKNLDTPDFDEKSFCTAPTKDLRAQNEIETVKKKSSKDPQLQIKNKGRKQKINQLIKQLLQLQLQQTTWW